MAAPVKAEHRATGKACCETATCKVLEQSRVTRLFHSMWSEHALLQQRHRRTSICILLFFSAFQIEQQASDLGM